MFSTKWNPPPPPRGGGRGGDVGEVNKNTLFIRELDNLIYSQKHWPLSHGGVEFSGQIKAELALQRQSCF
jgi:hypothetical protein